MGITSNIELQCFVEGKYGDSDKWRPCSNNNCYNRKRTVITTIVSDDIAKIMRGEK